MSQLNCILLSVMTLEYNQLDFANTGSFVGSGKTTKLVLEEQGNWGTRHCLSLIFLSFLCSYIITLNLLLCSPMLWTAISNLGKKLNTNCFSGLLISGYPFKILEHHELYLHRLINRICSLLFILQQNIYISKNKKKRINYLPLLFCLVQ